MAGGLSSPTGSQHSAWGSTAFRTERDLLKVYPNAHVATRGTGTPEDPYGTGPAPAKAPPPTAAPAMPLPVPPPTAAPVAAAPVVAAPAEAPASAVAALAQQTQAGWGAGSGSSGLRTGMGQRIGGGLAAFQRLSY